MRSPARFPRWMAVLAVSSASAAGVLSQSRKNEISETTEDRIAAATWWPTKNVPDRAQLVGNSECATCHTDKAATQATTPMAHAGARAADAEILRSHEQLTGELSPYRYEITRDTAGSTYSVSDGAQKISAQLEWAFGIAHTGQTYIYSRDGAYFESRVSFYKSLQSLALTTGHVSAPPSSIDAALGRRMDSSETQHCFGCHTSGSMVANRFDPAHATPGVTCEQCHGP